MTESTHQKLTKLFRHPFRFAKQVLRGFSENQSIFMAGAIAYYGLLSLLPLLIISVLILSQVIGQDVLLRVMAQYLEWLVPSQSDALLSETAAFMERRGVIGAVLAVTLLFFSSLAFTVLNKALAVIFHHRAVAVKRHPVASFLLPYGYVSALIVGLLVVSAVVTLLQAVGDESVVLFGHRYGFGGAASFMLYVLGVVCEVLFLSSIYWVMPAGNIPVHFALIGGASAAFLWEVVRHVLVWFFQSISQAGVVYGTLTTAVVVMLTLEIGAILVLFGAQIIAEFERFDDEQDITGPRPNES
jgi:YihY family inner membrane protein